MEYQRWNNSIIMLGVAVTPRLKVGPWGIWVAKMPAHPAIPAHGHAE